MNRERVIAKIQALCGLDEDLVLEAVDELGYDALTDKALEMIASWQVDKEIASCLERTQRNLSPSQYEEYEEYLHKWRERVLR